MIANKNLIYYVVILFNAILEDYRKKSYLVEGLYLAHTITSLNRNRCLNFL